MIFESFYEQISTESDAQSELELVIWRKSESMIIDS